MSLAQLAPQQRRGVLEFIVCAEADDQAAMQKQVNSARTGLMGSSHID